MLEVASNKGTRWLQEVARVASRGRAEAPLKIVIAEVRQGNSVIGEIKACLPPEAAVVAAATVVEVGVQAEVVAAVRAEVVVAEAVVVAAVDVGDKRFGVTQPLIMGSSLWNGGKSRDFAHQLDRKRFVAEA